MNITRTFARVLPITLLFAATTTPPVQAGFPVRSCKDICDTAIARCAAEGFHERFCRREVLGLCRHGSPICYGTPTTIPVCVTTTSTTTTTLPGPSNACLGPTGCSLVPTGVISTITSADEFRSRLLGIWYDCKDPMGLVPFAPSNTSGIEFTLTGEWYFLTTEAGRFHRDTGFGHAGRYTILDTSSLNGPGHFQLNLELNTGGTIIAQWTLAAQPQLLLLNNEGYSSALYSHMPGSAACSTTTRP